jgi:hypothetical protein
MNVELNDSLVVDFGGNVNVKVVSLADKSAEWIEWAISFGLRQSVKDAMAGKANTPEGEAALLAKFTKVCLEGQVPTKGAGGGGASLEDRIASKYLAKMGLKGKLEELDSRWMVFAKTTVLNSIEDKAEKSAVLKDMSQLEALAEEYMEAVKESAAASSEWAKIKAEMEGSKTPPAKLAIKISLK